MRKIAVKILTILLVVSAAILVLSGCASLDVQLDRDGSGTATLTLSKEEGVTKESIESELNEIFEGAAKLSQGRDVLKLKSVKESADGFSVKISFRRIRYIEGIGQYNFMSFSDFIKDFRQPDSLIVADPVLGDNGRLYTNFDMEMVKEMRHLITKADVITPNLTELFYLLDEPYKADSTDEELKEYLRLLSDKGPQVVIITSVPVHDEPHKTSVYAYNRQGNRYWKVTCPYLPAHYPGTGDTFTSVITGSLMQGDSLPMALDRATQFILQGIRATFGYEYDNREGILLEKVLHNLDMPIQMASYELI